MDEINYLKDIAGKSYARIIGDARVQQLKASPVGQLVQGKNPLPALQEEVTQGTIGGKPYRPQFQWAGEAGGGDFAKPGIGAGLIDKPEVANAGFYDTPLYHYSDTATHTVLKPGEAHPQNYLGDAVYATNQRGGYPGVNEYQIKVPEGLKTLDLTGGKEGAVGMKFTQKVADKLGIPFEPQGNGLYDDLRHMEYQMSPDKLNNRAVQTKIRGVVDEMTKGYDAIKAPWYDAVDGSTKNWELVIRNKEVPVTHLNDKPLSRVAQPTIDGVKK